MPKLLVAFLGEWNDHFSDLADVNENQNWNPTSFENSDSKINLDVLFDTQHPDNKKIEFSGNY